MSRCPVAERQKFFSLSFSDRQAVVAQRRQKLDQEDYRDKCRLRPAIEGTVSQFKQRTHNGKLRVRGYGRVRNAIISMAIGINFGRIWDYMEKKKRGLTSSMVFMTAIFLTLAATFARKWLRRELMDQSLAPQAVW